MIEKKKLKSLNRFTITNKIDNYNKRKEKKEKNEKWKKNPKETTEQVKIKV